MFPAPYAWPCERQQYAQGMSATSRGDERSIPHGVSHPYPPGRARWLCPPGDTPGPRREGTGHAVPEVSPAVRAALDAGRPVVALESTIISHGLPRPANLTAATSFEAQLNETGVTAATIA